MKVRNRYFLICLTALSGWMSPLPSNATDAATEFEAASRLYEEGRFAEAATNYATILQSGKASPALYFNLGNALFKSGQIGRAIVAYRRAEQLTPRDPDVRANLQFARNRVAGPTLRVRRWEGWLSELTLNEWSGLSAGALWLMFILLAAVQLRPQWRQTLRSYIIASGVAVFGFSTCLALSLALREADTAIVTVPDVTVRNGPLEESQSAFTANDGAELRVLDHKDNWLEVTDGNSRTGWLKRSDVTLLNAS